MSTESTSPVMNVESLQMKVENQQNVMKQLSNENEELYHQFNHLMIRNNKLLKRIDDLQKIIDDLHIRIEELQLINGNILKLNDRYRTGNDNAFADGDGLIKSNDTIEKENDNLISKTESSNVYSHWKNFPGQYAKNEPNLRKQAQMLVYLHREKSLRAADLFSKTGVGGVTGARYVAALKRAGLISYTGARKKGQYEMTQKGIDFVESSMHAPMKKESAFVPGTTGIPVIEQQGIPVKEGVKEVLASHFDGSVQ